MDLTKYDFDNTDSGSESQAKIEPGVHTLNFDGYEVVLVEITGKQSKYSLPLVILLLESIMLLQ